MLEVIRTFSLKSGYSLTNWAAAIKPLIDRQMIFNAFLEQAYLMFPPNMILAVTKNSAPES